MQSAAAPSGFTGRQFLVLFIAYLGWVFDLMDVFLMVLVKDKAMAELLGAGAAKADIDKWGGYALGITLVGWSLGGLIFGMVADRWGRTRTMALTILIYSVFTGLTGLSQTPMQLLILRFIAALGIGGEWAAGASLVAEVFPKTSRAVAAGILQSASGTGFFAAILLEYLVGGNWRHAFFAGAIPAFLALIVRAGLHEPDAWVAAKAKETASNLQERIGSLKSLFAEKELARRLLVATGLAVVGIFAYWGTTFWFNRFLVELLKGQGVASDQIGSMVRTGLIIQNIGNIVGFLSFIPITMWIGRRKAFFIYHLGALIFMPVAFLMTKSYDQALVLFFIAAIFASGIYSGYTIYFPELFPTRVRATGAGFCYNVGRIVAAPGPILMGYLIGAVDKVSYAGALMGAFYILAFIFIPLLPETNKTELE